MGRKIIIEPNLVANRGTWWQGGGPHYIIAHAKGSLARTRCKQYKRCSLQAHVALTQEFHPINACQPTKRTCWATKCTQRRSPTYLTFKIHRMSANSKSDVRGRNFGYRRTFKTTGTPSSIALNTSPEKPFPTNSMPPLKSSMSGNDPGRLRCMRKHKCACEL